jgi:hypothetical protein
MFGYFLRRVDKRFQLESALGMIDTPADTEEAVARLERLFAQVRTFFLCVGEYRHMVLLFALDTYVQWPGSERLPMTCMPRARQFGCM